MAEIAPPTDGKAAAAAVPAAGPASLTVVQWVRNEVRIIAPIITLVFLVVFFSLATTSFLSSRNLLNILEQSSLLTILGTGVTMVLLVGQIDLSFANQATLIGVILTMATTANYSPWIAIPACLLLGSVIGVTNGYFTAYRGVPAFMTTLAMLQITDGWAIYMTGGRPLFTVPEILDFLGNRRTGPIPNVVIMGLLVAGIAHFVLTYTRLGRYIYMVGGSPEAARVSGVNVKFINCLVFIICGFTAALYGLLGSGRLGSAQPGTYASVMVDGLAGVVLGGTSLFGGVGGMPYTIIGAVIYVVLSNGLNMMAIDIYVKTLVTGIVLLFAVVFNVYLQQLASEQR
jgi:ribose transport system permease protein